MSGRACVAKCSQCSRGKQAFANGFSLTILDGKRVSNAGFGRLTTKSHCLPCAKMLVPAEFTAKSVYLFYQTALG